MIEVGPLQSSEITNLIGLNPANAKIADVGVVICGASAADVPKEIQDRMLGNSGHAAGCVYRASFD
jgi:hypothetical protein